MSPTAHLPTGLPSTPLTIFAAAILFILLIMTGLSLVYLYVPTSLLSSLARCNRLVSRAESLFTTFAFTHTTTTYYRAHFAAASACANAFTIAMIIAILASVPLVFSRPCTDRAGLTVQGVYEWQVGTKNPTCNKQTENAYLPFLPLLLTPSPYALTHDNSSQPTQPPSLIGPAQFGGSTVVGGFLFDWLLVQWQNAHICLYHFTPKSGRLLRKNSLLPRSARAASIKENGGKRANWTRWA